MLSIHDGICFSLGRKKMYVIVVETKRNVNETKDQSEFSSSGSRKMELVKDSNNKLLSEERKAGKQNE